MSTKLKILLFATAVISVLAASYIYLNTYSSFHAKQISIDDASINNDPNNPQNADHLDGAVLNHGFEHKLKRERENRDDLPDQ